MSPDPLDRVASRHDGAPDAVLVVRSNDAGTITYANPAAARLLARDLDDLIGLGVDELLPARSRTNHRTLRQTMTHEPSDSRRRAHRVVPALIGGEDRLIVVDLAPIDRSGDQMLATMQPLEAWVDATAWTRSAFERSPTPIAVVQLTEDGDRIIRAANDALGELLGYSVGEMLGMGFDAVTFPDDEADDRAAASAMATGTTDRYVRRKRYRHRTGREVWCDLSSRLLANDRSGDALALAHLIDVSAQVELAELHRDTEARLRAEVDARTTALVDSEQQLRQSLAAASMASWRYDVIDDRFALVADDRSWPELRTGRTAADVLAMIHPDDVDSVREAVRSAVGTGRSFDITLRTRANLPRRWVRIAGDAIAGDDGRVTRVLGIVQDVSPIQALIDDLRGSDRLLREREDHLRLVLAATTTGTWDWNLAEDSIAFSREWLDHLGHDPDELGSTPWDWTRIVHPDDMAAFEQQLRVHFDHEISFCECVHRLRTGDGSWRWYRTRGRVVERDQAGRPQRMIGADVDISDKRQLEDQLVHGAKMQALGAFAGSVAHDFNNVMAIVRGHVELLRDPPGSATPDPADTERRLAAIEQSVDRASSFVRQLMALGRPEENRPADIDLAAFVLDLAPTLAQFLGEDIAFELDVPDGELAVRIDGGRLEALLLNLTANARDAMASGGTLTISLRSDRPRPDQWWAVLEIRDTGVGMDASTAASAFEPFFTTKAPGVGTGLGLANALATVSAAGGTIDVASIPDVGTTMTVSLPMTTTPIDPVRPTPAPRQPVRSATVLLVEDEAELLELTADAVRAHGHRVHTALSGAEALEILASDRVDLVVTDAVMPEMSGVELAAVVARRWPHLPILYVTGYAGDEAVPGAGPDDVLAKPVPHDVLIAAIEARVPHAADEASAP